MSYTDKTKRPTLKTDVICPSKWLFLLIFKRDLCANKGFSDTKIDYLLYLYGREKENNTPSYDAFF